MAERLTDAIAIFGAATLGTILLLGSAGALKQRYTVLKEVDFGVFGAEYDEYDDANVMNYYFGEDADYATK